MTEVWMIRTHGDPLAAIRQLIQNLWRQARLAGMLAPVYDDGETGVTPKMLTTPGQVPEIDPCVPLMPVNAAKLVAVQARQNPGVRFGAILRSCEARALDEIARREELDLSPWLIIGVDCLASFPAEDFDWRLQKAGSIEDLTRENLTHARQGGIALHRFRNACQMCTTPEAGPADISICLLGLPVKETILVKAKDAATAGEIRLSQITDGFADAALIAQYAQMLETLHERRTRTLERMIADLGAELPEDVESLITHLQNCAPCRDCLDVCPIYAAEVGQIGDEQPITRESAVRWLVSCVSCGMCEQTCPNHLPLTAVVRRIKEQLIQEAVAI
jgi:formate dehydrogenase (coenzyme F420) beta subunit